MAKNHVKPSDIITVIAPVGGATNGTPLVVGSLVVIPLNTVAEGEEVECATGDIWRLPKTAANTPAQGAPAYWNGTEVTTTATDNDRIGYFAKAYGNGDTEAEVMVQQLL